MVKKNNGCLYGNVTRQMVKDIKDDVKEIKECVKGLTNHYSRRLPMWASVIISILSSLVVGLIVYGVK